LVQYRVRFLNKKNDQRQLNTAANVLGIDHPLRRDQDKPEKKKARLLPKVGREIVGPGYSDTPSTRGIEVSKRRHEARMKVAWGATYPVQATIKRFGGQDGGCRRGNIEGPHGT
jgi:hypothetical protein